MLVLNPILFLSKHPLDGEDVFLGVPPGGAVALLEVLDQLVYLLFAPRGAVFFVPAVLVGVVKAVLLYVDAALVREVIQEKLGDL